MKLAAIQGDMAVWAGANVWHLLQKPPHLRSGCEMPPAAYESKQSCTICTTVFSILRRQARPEAGWNIALTQSERAHARCLRLFTSARLSQPWPRTYARPHTPCGLPIVIAWPCT